MNWNMKWHRIPGFVAIVIGSGWMASAPLWAISCFSDLRLVRDVKAEHLLHQARSIVRRMAELGVPFDGWELEVLETAFQSPQAPWAVVEIQRVFDAHCLIALSVSAEAEIKAAAGPALPFTPTGGWGTFLIKVDNLGRQGSPLHVESPNAIEPRGAPDADRWMQFKLWPEDATLSGERVDYFLLQIHSQERGKREALFAFSSGLRPLQSPGPLSYNRHPVLFTLMDASEISRAKLAHLLRHAHGPGYWDARNRKAPPLATIRTEACLDCHAATKESQTTLARLEREKSCMACHRELSAGPRTSTRCSICGMENCEIGCQTRGRTRSGKPVVLMSGIPRPLFLGGVACVLLLSFVVVELMDRKSRPKRPAQSNPCPSAVGTLTSTSDSDAEKGKGWRWNFLSLRLPKVLFRQAWIRPAFQVPVFLLFCFLIYAGFAGDQTVNITPTRT